MKEAEQVPFSRCGIWRSHREFFVAEGISAWNGRVPFYVTSNPYLAHAYATIIVRFLQDRRAAGGPVEGPALVLELGAGTGAFSYQVLRCLVELTGAVPDLAADLCYVMSDISERNLDFWSSHPAFAPFLEQGLLDFAFFDVESSGRLDLRVSQRVVERRPGQPAPPLVVIANYVFDAVPPDFFRLEDGRLSEVLVPESLTLPPNEEANASFEITRIDGSRWHGVAEPRYAPESVDRVLRDCAASQIEGGFLFPAAALGCLARLRETIAHEILLLVADKGILAPASIPEASRLTLGLHGGCASSLLDFYALECFARSQGGDAYTCQTEGIVTAAYSLGAEFSELPETRLALAQFLGVFNPGYLYDVVHYFQASKPGARLETLIALLELTLWDPYVVDQFFDVLLASLPYAGSYGIGKLSENLHRVADNFFYLPSAPDTFFQLGVLLQEMQHHDEALRAYEASLSWFGEVAGTLYRMGQCCHALRRVDDAVGWFRRALQQRPDFVEARGWIAQIEEDRREERHVDESGHP
ncbi:MAG TPA: hypothetical protein DD490_29910 [Acidobacteria bacterium]|nr:hypothetical protein [Acidobacteriota bacterium]